MSTSYELLVVGSGPAGQKGSRSRDGASAPADHAARPPAGARRPAGAKTVGAARRTGPRARQNRFHRNDFVTDAGGDARGMTPALSTGGMLKITIETDDSGVHLKLEGELAGNWVRDLEIYWRLAARATSVFSLPVCVDLADCSRVDAAGRYLLALLHQNGTRLVAGGVVMTELVESLAREWPVPTSTQEGMAACAMFNEATGQEQGKEIKE